MKNRLFFYCLNIYFIIFFYLVFFSCKNSTISKAQTDFAVSDTSIVTKIIILNGSDSIILSKNISKWYVNNVFSANINKINNLLSTLFLLQIKSPIPEDAFASVKTKLFNNTRVIVYSNKNIINDFYIADFVNNTGNYAMTSKKQIPFLIYLPSYNFDILKIFSTDIKTWQSKILFEFESSKINSIFLRNYQYDETFYILKKDNEFEVYQSKIDQNKKDKNSDNIERYLSYYKNVEFVDFYENQSKNILDSLKNEIPIFELEIQNSEKQNINFKAYKIENNNKIDNTKFLGMINNNTLVIAKYYDFDLLLKNYTYFVK